MIAVIFEIDQKVKKNWLHLDFYKSVSGYAFTVKIMLPDRGGIYSDGKEYQSLDGAKAAAFLSLKDNFGQCEKELRRFKFYQDIEAMQGGLFEGAV
jgi:hypothetical protein